ncbi:MAG: hypothetical protein IPK16_17785 [Anaerolineales bacterium]|nr:hypothetical protein [Anaerolineales bacterium]
MKQRLWVVFSLLLVASMVLAACGAPEAEAPAQPAAAPAEGGKVIKVGAVPADRAGCWLGRRSVHQVAPDGH